jgi:hypothetical protein
MLFILYEIYLMSVCPSFCNIGMNCPHESALRIRFERIVTQPQDTQYGHVYRVVQSTLDPLSDRAIFRVFNGREIAIELFNFFPWVTVCFRTDETMKHFVK